MSDSPFEEEFLRRVLAQVQGLRPEHVRPQFGFVDTHGRQRRIDFAVMVGELKLAIEVDGTEKVLGSPGLAGKRMEETWQRQNDLGADGWQILRFTNLQVMLESASCARQIRERLQAADQLRHLAASSLAVAPSPAAPAPAAPAAAVSGPDPAAAAPASPASSPEQQTPSEVPPLQIASRGSPRTTAWVAIALVLAIGAVAVAAFFGMRDKSPDAGPSIDRPTASAQGVSEQRQREADIKAGARAPLTKFDCPKTHPLKANYNTRTLTHYYFQPGSTFYSRTTPTSCWASIEGAAAGGYEQASPG